MIDEVILNRNKNINRGYRKLVVWQEAIELFAFVKKKLKSLNTISYKLNAQIEDSIFSVHSNIAEGYCRRHLKENIQFNSIALASLGENYSHFFVLLNSSTSSSIISMVFSGVGLLEVYAFTTSSFCSGFQPVPVSVIYFS